MNTSVNTSVNCATKRHQTLGLWGKLMQMSAIRRQRRQLLALDAHMLADIGVTRDEAIAESRETLWNAPNHWSN
jgi:uncharacterized protein YjiS (DUF1127 family)